MKKAPHNFQADGASGEELSFVDPPPFCQTWPTKTALADLAVGAACWGFMPINVADWIIRRLHLGAA